MAPPPIENRETPHPCEKIKVKKTCDDIPRTTHKPPPAAGKESIVKIKPTAQMKNIKADAQGLINKALTTISKSSGTQQLLIGSVSGWTTGFLTMKVGRTAAFAVGGSIILFQLAQHKQFIDMDWEKVKQKMENTTKKFDASYSNKAPTWKANVTRFARTNTCFAAGFVGGFLIGLAS
ncbi:hypothetical protein ILUMI_21886 [Ignelater luminosus]|uniref:FUN14 domain-containing protein 1 n=1 Tax=Ignelater luminosus TaxID=2038154 RepID=A0A8K0G3B1_IGNLU|nr:hypothetical protein ILUMI_21886 [Ignelater luminosus]